MLRSEMLQAATRSGANAEEWSATLSYKEWSQCWGVKCYAQPLGLEPLPKSEALIAAKRTRATAEEWSATPNVATRTEATAEERSATRSYKDWSHCWWVKCYTQLQGLEPLLRSEVLHAATRTGATADEWCATHSYKDWSHCWGVKCYTQLQDWSHCWGVKCYTQLQGLEPLLRSEMLHAAARTGATAEERSATRSYKYWSHC
jgi:hypothetical protein